MVDPDADAPGRAAGDDAELGERADHPSFEGMDESPHVPAPALEVELDVDHALARAVIGVSPAAAGGVDRQALRVEQLGRVGAGAGGVEGRMLEQPDQL